MSLTVNILTPERAVLQTQADSIVVPAIDGELGILTDHAPLLAQLQEGEIRMRSGSDVKIFAVSGGFVEVHKNEVILLAETAEMSHEIDVERARQAADRAKAALRASTEEVDIANAEAALRRALVRLRAVDTVRRHRPSAPR